MFSYRVPSDIVKAIFHYLGAGATFSSDTNKINEAFYKISQSDNLSNLFNDFVFDTSKVFPYCPTIRFALDRLQKSDLLLLRNLDLNKYEVPKALANESDIEKLFPDKAERMLLRKASREFRNLI